MVERLEAKGVDRPGQGSVSPSSKLPKADQLVVQLTQGLQSGDAKLLTKAFQEQNMATLVSTVKRLPQHVIHALVKEVIHRMYGQPQSALSMVYWMKSIMSTCMDYLVNDPDMMDSVTELMQYLEHRQQSMSKRLEEQGKLHLLQSRVSTQCEMEEPPMSVEPLLTNQDEWIEEEDMPMEFGASESEDNWKDSDAD